MSSEGPSSEVPAESPDTPLEWLEAASREVEELANRVVLQAKAFGAEVGGLHRIELVKQRLKIALDELGGYPTTVGDITDE